jgi:hypothetical protein
MPFFRRKETPDVFVSPSLQRSKMSSPSLSVRSIAESSRSPSPRPSSASTAPSTPSEAPATHFLVTHSASASFLQSLPARRSSYDRILHFTGAGLINGLLLQASDIVADPSLAVADSWEHVKASDNGELVEYWYTKSAASNIAVAPDSADITNLEVSSENVSLFSLYMLTFSSRLL